MRKLNSGILVSSEVALKAASRSHDHDLSRKQPLCQTVSLLHPGGCSLPHAHPPPENPLQEGLFPPGAGWKGLKPNHGPRWSLWLILSSGHGQQPPDWETLLLLWPSLYVLPVCKAVWLHHSVLGWPSSDPAQCSLLLLPTIFMCCHRVAVEFLVGGRFQAS